VRKILVEIKRLVAILVMLPFWALTARTKYVFVGQMISMIPLHFGEIVRYEFYRRTLAACGEDVTIGFGSYISYRDVTIGSHVWIDAFCNVGHADIGDYVLVARNCHFVSGHHPFERTDMAIWEQQEQPSRVKIGSDIWFGSGVIILADVNSGCVVGAGSIVTRPLAPLSVAAGNPARVIRTRGENKTEPDMARE
jgi:virginiamycin A acetyltransferase